MLKNVDLTHLCRVDPSSTSLFGNSLDQSIFNSRRLDSSYYLLCFIEILVLNANIVDPDQMPHSAASDLGPHYLPITFLCISGLNRVILFIYLFIYVFF